MRACWRISARLGIAFFLTGLDPSAVPRGWALDSAVYSDSPPGTAVVSARI
jgi:hypothetical protein